MKSVESFPLGIHLEVVAISAIEVVELSFGYC